MAPSTSFFEYSRANFLSKPQQIYVEKEAIHRMDVRMVRSTRREGYTSAHGTGLIDTSRTLFQRTEVAELDACDEGWAVGHGSRGRHRSGVLEKGHAHL